MEQEMVQNGSQKLHVQQRIEITVSSYQAFIGKKKCTQIGMDTQTKAQWCQLMYYRKSTVKTIALNYKIP